MIDRLLEIVLLNALIAVGLAGLVALVAPRLRSPALVHGLWLLVLVKLITPPAVRIGALLPAADPAADPAIGTPVATEPLSAAPTLHAAPSRAASPDLAPASEPGLDLRPALPTKPALLIALAGGAVLLLGLAAYREIRFRRAIRAGRPAPPPLRDRAARVAAQLGLDQVPPIRLVDGAISPALRVTRGRPEVVLPAELLQTLSPGELDSILAHEFAHVRRRDHWVRPFELLAVAAFWWHPVAWWARRNLRIAEERACDDLVLRAFPGLARAYADGLLKTLDLLTARRTRTPALATGAGESHYLKERLVMIMTPRTIRSPSATARGILIALAVTVVLVSPARLFGRAVEAAPAAVTASGSPPETIYELRRRQLQIEGEMQRLQITHHRLAQEIEDAKAQWKVDQLHAEIQGLEEAGDTAKLSERRLRLAEMQQQAEFQARRARLQIEAQERELALQAELEERSILRQELTSRGEESGAIQAETQRLRYELQALQASSQRARLELQLEELQVREAYAAEFRNRAAKLAAEAAEAAGAAGAAPGVARR